MNKKLGYQILELCGILLGNAILAFGIAAFVLPHGMITGGATGLGLVTSRAFGVDLSVAVAVYNIILFAVGAFVLGKKFALTTIVSTIVYPMFLSFFTQQQWIATMTNDILLSAIYAGIMVGLGVGIVIRFGASTGGLDIPPLILIKIGDSGGGFYVFFRFHSASVTGCYIDKRTGSVWNPDRNLKFHCTRICLFGRTEKSTGYDHIQALSGNSRYASSETGSWCHNVSY